MHKVLFLVAVVVAATPLRGHAAEVDFVRDVQPVLQRHCYSCHGPEKQKSGLRLDIKSEALKGGDGWGPSLVAGQASDSPLIELVTSDDSDSRMPPDGDPLSAAEIQTLTKWIDEGAVWPDGVDQAKVVDNRDHWSFKPLAVPSGDLSIDHFIDAEACRERSRPESSRRFTHARPPNLFRPHRPAALSQ